MFSCSVGEGPCNPNPCLNGGQCTGEGQTYTCECVGGFTGNTCEIGMSTKTMSSIAIYTMTLE